MKRKVAQLISPRKFEVIEEKLKPIESDDLLVKMVSIGLCHSDIPTYLGKFREAISSEGKYYADEKIEYPIGIGHEPVGIIEEVGKDLKNVDFKVGDYITGEMFSSFASYVIIKPKMSLVIKLPDNVKQPEYCLGEPLMCISNIIRTADPEFGDYVAVIGCGMMGLATISGLAKSAAFELIGIDLVNDRLKLAKEYGATAIVNPKEVDAFSTIQDITKGHGVDIVVEISGHLAGFSLACKILKGGTIQSFGTRGKILIPSLYGIPEIMDAGYNLMYKSPIIHSTHIFYSLDPMDDLRKGIEGYIRGILPLNKMITHEFKLEEINEAFEMLEKLTPGYLKGIVKP